LNKITLSILNRIIKSCNKADKLISQVSVNITSVRHKDYFSCSVNDRNVAHKEFEIIALSVPGFTISYERLAFGDNPLLKRIEINDLRLLLAYLNEPVIFESVNYAIETFLDSTKTFHDSCQGDIMLVEPLWRCGKSAFGCRSIDYETLIDSFKCYSWLKSNDTSKTYSDIRTISAELYGNSKRLEQLVNVVARILKDQSPDALKDEKPIMILAYWGINKFPPNFRLKGSIQIETKKGLFQTDHCWPYISYPPDGIDKLSIHQTPPYVLFIENKTTFNRYCREVDDPGLIFYTNGFPSRHWQALYKQIILNIPSQTPIYHWGDTDEGGFKILIFIQKLIQRDLIPYMMLVKNSPYQDRVISFDTILKITSDFDGTEIGKVHNELKSMQINNQNLYWVEQEALNIRSPLFE
jgi:hypothetical protein